MAPGRARRADLYFYPSNQHTMSLVFGRNLTTNKALNERLSHVIEYTPGYLVRE